MPVLFLRVRGLVLTIILSVFCSSCALNRQSQKVGYLCSGGVWCPQFFLSPSCSTVILKQDRAGMREAPTQGSLFRLLLTSKV